jgi:UDP-glucose 4-epimerase
MRVNMIGTYNALEAALATRTRSSGRRLLDERGLRHARVQRREEHVTTIGSVGEARWTYAVSKLAGEHMAHAVPRELGLPTVSCGRSTSTGPGQIGGGAIRAFIEAALAGRDPRDPRRRSQIRAWCYVDDMVRRCCWRSSNPSAVRGELQHGNCPLPPVTI